jgi:uncharacterized iron-regulated membrane protein
MKEHFRQNMAWLHTWTGLLAGWVMFYVMVAGSATVFQHEITRWMQPELPLRVEQQYPPTAEMVETALDFLVRQREVGDSWSIYLPSDGRHVGNLGNRAGADDANGVGLRGYQTFLTVMWQGGSARLDPVAGTVRHPPEVRATEGGNFFADTHYRLHYVSWGTGLNIVGSAAMLMLIALVTGLIVHKRVFKDFFTFRPNKGTRSWLDAHHLFGVMTLPFLLMIVYSGLALNMHGYMPASEAAMPEEEEEIREFPPPVTRPTVSIAEVVAKAEKLLGVGEIGVIGISRSEARKPRIEFSRHWGTQFPFSSGERFVFDGETGKRLLDIKETRGQAPAWKALWYLAGLHYAWFPGANLRWLYFVSCLTGCALIASGLILWATQRRARHFQKTEESATTPTGEDRRPQDIGFRLVETLNIATIAGLPIGIAAYFWANRLLPFAMLDRAEWEIHALFFTWAWLAGYAVLRPPKRAWVELLTLAAAAFALLPVLNFLTTDKHLAATMAHGDWVLAAVDLTFLALGGAFGSIAWRLRRKRGMVLRALPVIHPAH